MKKLLLFFGCILLAITVRAQKYVDTLYEINTETNLTYGEAINFAGEMVNLLLDVSYPTNDTLAT